MRPARLLHLLWVATAACNEPPRPAFTELPAPRPVELAPRVAAQAFTPSSGEVKLTLHGRRVEVALPTRLQRCQVEAALEPGRLEAGQCLFELADAPGLEGLSSPSPLQLSWTAEHAASLAPERGVRRSGSLRSLRRVRATLLLNRHRSEQELTLRLWQRPGQPPTLAGELQFELVPHGLLLSAPADKAPSPRTRSSSDGSPRSAIPQPLQNARLSFEMGLESEASSRASEVIAAAEP